MKSEDIKAETLTAVGSSAWFGVIPDMQKTRSSQNLTQITLEDVINGWRPRFPKLSDLLSHAERYPNVLPILERTLRRHLKPLLVQWQKDDRPDIDWPEPLEYQ